jgi:hypothetical protein
VKTLAWKTLALAALAAGACTWTLDESRIEEQRPLAGGSAGAGGKPDSGSGGAGGSAGTTGAGGGGVGGASGSDGTGGVSGSGGSGGGGTGGSGGTAASGGTGGGTGGSGGTGGDDPCPTCAWWICTCGNGLTKAKGCSGMSCLPAEHDVVCPKACEMRGGFTGTAVLEGSDAGPDV